VLNTPKSLTSPPEADSVRQVASRRLFPDRRQEEAGRRGGHRHHQLKGVREEGEWPRHPAPTSQVNEYENISPTPSTDL
jgi:hypothetical protein